MTECLSFFLLKRHSTKKFDYDVTFVGHPLIDAIADRKPVNEVKFRKEHSLGEKPIVALLPGSRKQEITKMLTVMLSLVDDFQHINLSLQELPVSSLHFTGRL